MLKKKEIDIENTQKEADDLSLMASKKKDFDLLDVSNEKWANVSKINKEDKRIEKKLWKIDIVLVNI